MLSIANPRRHVPLAAGAVLLAAAGSAHALAVSDTMQIGAGTSADPVLFTGTLYEGPNDVDLDAQGNPQAWMFTYTSGLGLPSGIKTPFDIGLVGLIEPYAPGVTSGPRQLSDAVIHVHAPAIPFVSASFDAWLMVTDSDAGTFNADLSGMSALWNTCKSTLGFAGVSASVKSSVVSAIDAALGHVNVTTDATWTVPLVSTAKLSFLEETGLVQDLTSQLLSPKAVLVMSDIHPVPLPGSFALFASAFSFALTALRRRSS
ncbi:MAG: hypothetical protein HY749_00330 [Gammaproteobacteria bacterium]|nr:hypothetical protein [Gammaproteobacteria bacterium]